MCYQPEFLVSLINRNWSEARQEIQARLYWGPCCSREEREQVTDSLACLFPKVGASSFLIRNEGRDVSRGLARRVAWVVCPPFRWCCVQGACTVPCFCYQLPVFAPGSSEVAVGLFCGFFVSFVQNLPQLHMHTVTFSPFQFLPVLRFVERCVQVQALQHCSRGSQVPACHPISVEKFRGWILAGQ